MWTYMAYTPRSGNHREYIVESGVYISTAREYIAESGVYISTTREYIAECIFGKLFTIAAQRNGRFFLVCHGMANSTPQCT